MILVDCIEKRITHSQDYSTVDPLATQVAWRELQQAMVPGAKLVSVKIDRHFYQDVVVPLQQQQPGNNEEQHEEDWL